jgi:transcription antitermination factor NusG
MSTQIMEAFFAGKRSAELPLVVNDTAKILRGDYAGRSGAVVLVDSSKEMLQFLVEFGDGTDELVSLDNLEKI